MHNPQHDDAYRGGATAAPRQVREVLGLTGPYFRIVTGLLSFVPLVMMGLDGSSQLLMEPTPAAAFAVVGAGLLGFEVWLRTRRTLIVLHATAANQLLRGNRIIGTFAPHEARAFAALKETTQLIRGLLLYSLVGGVGVVMALTDLPRAGWCLVAFAVVGMALLVRDRIVLRHCFVKDRCILLRASDARSFLGAS